MNKDVIFIKDDYKTVMEFRSDEMYMKLYYRDTDTGKFGGCCTRERIEYNEIYNRITEFALNNSNSDKTVCDMVAGCIEAEIISSWSRSFIDETARNFLTSEEVIETFRETIF